jgi:hypothetical protein
LQVLLLWPLLVVGTLTGTVLLITLPLGALIWFITLILARSACRLEVCMPNTLRLVTPSVLLIHLLLLPFPHQLKMQLFFHSPLRSSIPRPNYFPIFRRIKLSPGADGQVRPVVEVYGEGNEAEVAGIVHERNFFKNCWSMVCRLVSLPHPRSRCLFPSLCSSLVSIGNFTPSASGITNRLGTQKTTCPINAYTTSSSPKHSSPFSPHSLSSFSFPSRRHSSSRFPVRLNWFGDLEDGRLELLSRGYSSRVRARYGKDIRGMTRGRV